MIKSKIRIAIIDDDPDILELLMAYLTDQGFSVTCFSCPMSFINVFRATAYDLIISDVVMPEKSGLEIIEHVKISNPNLPIILLTAHAAVEEAVLALKKGAYDFLQKPFLLERLLNTIKHAVENYLLILENKNLKGQVKSQQQQGKMMGRSKAMQEISAIIDRIGPTSANILITGESGTGKEVVARAIHDKSSNPQGPFIAINCAAIPEALLESELFGHVKGAFTGATTNRPGLFQEARNGSLFLDEIGDMPPSLQSKLLRVLQEKKIRPIGSNSSNKIEVRIIAATHKNLPKAVKEGNFREDLFYRLTVIPIHIPPLRNRPEDIPGLTQFFLDKFQKIHGTCATSISTEALDRLMQMPWYGNVRELENTIERMTILANGDKITLEDLPIINYYNTSPSQIIEDQLTHDLPNLKEFERRYIEWVISQKGGDKRKAAQILGKNWRTIYRKLQHQCSQVERI